LNRILGRRKKVLISQFKLLIKRQELTSQIAKNKKELDALDRALMEA